MSSSSAGFAEGWRREGAASHGTRRGHPGRGPRRSVGIVVLAVHVSIALVLWRPAATRLHAAASPLMVRLLFDAAPSATTHASLPPRPLSTAPPPAAQRVAKPTLPTRRGALQTPTPLAAAEVPPTTDLAPVAMALPTEPTSAPAVALAPFEMPASAAAAPVPAPAPAPAPRVRKEVAASAVSYLVQPPAEVPALSRRARESGTVWLRVVVDIRGLPVEVQVHRSSGFQRLDEQALWAMRRARFRPYTEDGRATEVAVTAPIEYPPD